MRAVLILAALLFSAGEARAGDLDRSPSWEERMLDAINAERAERGLPRYRVDRRLERAAAEHSRRMAETNRLSHQLPGEPPLKARVAATGLRFDAVGENVGYSTRVEDLHPNLMRSRGHRQNLLATKYDSIGIAIYQSGGRWYVTQDFANTTSEATASEAEDEFAAAVADLRRRRRLPSIAIRGNDELRAAACTMARRDDVDVDLVPHVRGHRHVVAFTTFEPGELNEHAREVAGGNDLTRLEIGVCQRSSRRYPAGVFWFAVAY